MREQRNQGHLSAERLAALLEGELRSAERARAEEHLGGCARCSAELDTWRILFGELSELPELSPTPGFADRVLSGARVPERVPLATRVRQRVGELIAPLARGHVAPALLEDFVEGILPAARAARVRQHLGSCAACAAESRQVGALFERLESLERFEPSPGFADRVVAALGARVPARAARAVPAWTRLVAAARGLVPHTRRAWATVSGVAVTPVVTAGLMLYVVFSHPTVTPAALLAFAKWKVAALGGLLWQSVIARALESAQLFDLYALGEAVSGAPLAVAGGVLAYSLSCALALRILYKNLFAQRAVSVTRHA